MLETRAEKDRAEEAKFEHLLRGCKGKDYGYDHDGQVVIMQGLDPDRLPIISVVPRINVTRDSHGQDETVEKWTSAKQKASSFATCTCASLTNCLFLQRCHLLSSYLYRYRKRRIS